MKCVLVCCLFVFMCGQARAYVHMCIYVCVCVCVCVCVQWHTEGGGLGGSNPFRNSEDIGGVLDRMSKKNRSLDFLLHFTVFSYGCNLLNKGFF